MPVYHTEAGPVEMRAWGAGGELVLLLHAAATGPGSLTGLATALARPGRRIVAPALPGYGATAIRADGDILDAHAAAAAFCLSHYEADRRIVFGHSMGGLVALLAAMGGAPIDALWLYEPIVIGCLRDDDPLDVACRAWDRAILAAFARDLDAGDAETGIARFVEAWNETAWRDLPSAVRARLVAAASGIAAEVRATSFRLLDADRLAAVAADVLILQGSASPPITRRMTARLRDAVPSAQLLVLEGSGHMAPVQAPTRVAAATGHFRPVRPTALPCGSRRLC